MSERHGPALVVPRTGGSDVLVVEDRSAPAPGRGEAVAEVAAVGVNFIDVYQREGVYPMDVPFVLGNEGAGTVVAVGEVGLGGEVRPVGRIEHRLSEAARLGFRQAVVPRGTPTVAGLQRIEVGTVLEATGALGLLGGREAA